MPKLMWMFPLLALLAFGAARVVYELGSVDGFGILCVAGGYQLGLWYSCYTHWKAGVH